MHYDFFLTNRALQIQRLLDGTSTGKIEIPDRHSRAGCSRHLAGLYKSVDRIAKLPVGDKQKASLLSKLRIGSLMSRGKQQQKPLLTAAQRDLLMEFERQLVRVGLEDDADSERAGTSIFNAIIADHEYFNGLKPIPQYSDDFAYELMFPTWLNLNTAMVQRAAGGQEPRFSTQQRQTCVRFLDDWRYESKQDDGPLVAIMTFLASRYPPPQSHRLLQRMIDLCFDKNAVASAEHVTRLARLQEQTDSARVLAKRFVDYLVVHSCLSAKRQKKYDVAGTRLFNEELPRAVSETLARVRDDEQRQDAYWLLLGLSRTVIENANGFDPKFEDLLNQYPSQLPELLGLVVDADESPRARTQLVQSLVAQVASRELSDGQRVNVERIKPFAACIARRMDSMPRSAALFFQSDFVSKAANRRAVISGCRDDDSRCQVAGQLIQGAKSAKNAERLLNLLAIAAAVDASIDSESLAGIHASIAVLQMAQSDQSIGRNELSDLVTDIQQGLPDSLGTLARPLEAAMQKSERLAKLYLALNEEVEILRHSGKVSNFGVTRASFSNLSRLAEDE